MPAPAPNIGEMPLRANAHNFRQAIGHGHNIIARGRRRSPLTRTAALRSRLIHLRRRNPLEDPTAEQILGWMSFLVWFELPCQGCQYFRRLHRCPCRANYGCRLLPGPSSTRSTGFGIQDDSLAVDSHDHNFLL
jgi:hypothetical protein